MKPVTQKQNLENLGLSKTNKSGYRGVYKHSQYDRWAVNVNHNGKTVYGGVYADLLDAAQAARDLRNKLYTNNVDDRLHEEERNG